MNVALLAGTVLCNASAQLLLKEGASRLGERAGISALCAMARTPHVLAGLGLYAASFVMYLLILREAEVSRASPLVMASAFVLIYLFSIAFLGEALTWQKSTGIALVIAGLLVLSTGG